MTSLEPFAVGSRTRGVDAILYDEENKLEVSVSRYQGRSGGVSALFGLKLYAAESGEKIAEITSGNGVSGEHPEVGARARISEAVQSLGDGLPEDQSSWLREVWGETQVEEDSLRVFAVDNLLDDENCPFDVLDVADHSLIRDIKGNLHIYAVWWDGNVTFTRDWQTDQPTTVIMLDRDGSKGQEQYLYRRYKDGREKLEIRDRTVQGSDDAPESFAQQIEALHEAGRLGLDEINDAKLQRFNKALADVVGSLQEAA